MHSPELAANNVSVNATEFLAIDETKMSKRIRPIWNKGEIRLNDDDSIDEIVVFNVDLHIEQMSDKHWWIGVLGDSQNKNLSLKFRRVGKKIKLTVWGDGGIEEGYK